VHLIADETNVMAGGILGKDVTDTREIDKRVAPVGSFN
jgi:hypothetical protein